jgi:peptidoglycan/LPS O-acetylase OafA/YrhL
VQVLQPEDEKPAPSDPGGRFGYQPALDGIRALAVIAVVLFHQFAGGATGGFLGVSVFFVLSGFLITSILLAEHNRAGRVSFPGFWGRRAQRLLPALGVFLLLIALYSHLFAAPLARDRLRSDSFAILGYVENYWALWRPFQTLPLGHTWSLSVEEQFYILWPLILVGLLWFTRRNGRATLLVIGTLIVASAAAMAWLYNERGFSHAYVRTESRAHELLVGAFLGVLLATGARPRSRLGRGILEACGIAALVAFVVAIRFVTEYSSWLYHGGLLLIAICTAVTITAAMQPSSPVLGRMLSWRPLVAVGLVSYGIYLFHVPIYFMITPRRVHLTGLPLFGVRLGALAIITLASYFLVERPIRRHKFSWSSAVKVGIPALGVVVVAILVSTVGAVPWTRANLQEQAYRNSSENAPAGATKVLVSGDALTNGLPSDHPYSENGIHGVVDRGWCTLLPSSVVISERIVARPRCSLTTRRWSRNVKAFDADVAVLMIGAEEVLDRADGQTRLAAGSPAAAAFLQERLARTRRVLTANGAELVVVPVPCMRAAKWSVPDEADARRRINWVNGELSKFVSRYDLRVLDVAAELCPGGSLAPELRAADGVGLSEDGSAVLWNRLAAELGD